jgi:hypothetical protein
MVPAQERPVSRVAHWVCGNRDRDRRDDPVFVPIAVIVVVTAAAPLHGLLKNVARNVRRPKAAHQTRHPSFYIPSAASDKEWVFITISAASEIH